MKNTTSLYYLSSYITALRSTKLDGRLFADLPTQQAHFRHKAMEVIHGMSELLNWSEISRQANIDRARWQDIMRGKSSADATDLQRVHDVLAKHFA